MIVKITQLLLPNFEFEFTKNKRLVLLRLGQLSLEQTPEAWKSDTNIVRQAVNAFGCNFKYAAAHLKSDRETVLIALNNDGNAFEYISEDLQNNKELFLLANNTYRYFEPSYGHILQFANPQLQDDYDIALVEIKSNGLAYKEDGHGDGWLENTSPFFKDDPEVVLAAIKNHRAKEIRFSSKRLLANTDFLLSAYRINNSIRKYLTAIAYNQLKNAVISYNKNIVL